MTTAESSKKTVVIVDDDKFLADMYSMKFSREGYDVHAYLSADDALSALKKSCNADAIIFDLVMPSKDGFAFLSEIASNGLCPKAALIALTNQSNDTERLNVEKLGCNRYVIKAATIPSEVVAIVAEEIAKKGR